MKKGTLVLIKENEEQAVGDHRAVQRHGRLWIYVEPTSDIHPAEDLLRTYKALSDGEIFCWFDSQVEEAP